MHTNELSSEDIMDLLVKDSNSGNDIPMADLTIALNTPDEPKHHENQTPKY